MIYFIIIIFNIFFLGHFCSCGEINRIKIQADKHTKQPKGFAYIEFVTKDAVDKALKLDDSEFKGRKLKVLPKRHNVPVVRGGGGGRGSGRFNNSGGRGGRFNNSRGGGGGGRFNNSRGGGGGRFNNSGRGGRFNNSRGGGGRFNNSGRNPYY